MLKCISAIELSRKIRDRERLTIIDIRYPIEFKTYHIPNSINIPFPGTTLKMYNIPLENSIVVVCQSGIYSKAFSYKLCKMGYKNISNLTGGIQSWLSCGVY